MPKSDPQLCEEAWAEFNARMNLTIALLTHSEANLELSLSESKIIRAELGARNAELGARNAELGARNAELGARNAELDAQKADNEALRRALSSREAEVERLEEVLRSRESELECLRDELLDRDSEIGRLANLNDEILSSTSWKVTAPIRYLLNSIRARFK